MVTFPIAGDAALVLSLDDNLSYYSLELSHPSLPQPVLLGWDDPVGWHPHVLRWENLDLFGRCIALADPSLPHPGLPVLLLCRFAPICVGDDVDVIFPLLERAWRSLGRLTDREIDAFIDRVDRRQACFTWERHEPVGWTLSQEKAGLAASGYELYTLRKPDNDQFPFQALNDTVRAARQACREV